MKYSFQLIMDTYLIQENQTWSWEEPGLWAVVVLEGPDEIPAGVTDVLLDERHARVVEGRPTVDDAVVATPVRLVYHGEIKLVDPRRVDLGGTGIPFMWGRAKVKHIFPKWYLPDLWWLPNEILRHIYKIRFWFFRHSVHVWLQSLQYDQKNLCKKCNMDIKKTQNLIFWFLICW